jgi:DDE superfamily endonuclease
VRTDVETRTLSTESAPPYTRNCHFLIPLLTFLASLMELQLQSLASTMMMVSYNAFTGLRRREPKRNLSWKVRSTHSSTVAARMYGKAAMAAFRKYLKTAQQSLAMAGVLALQPIILQPQLASLIDFLLSSSAHFFSSALRMVQLESDLLDMAPGSDTLPLFQNTLRSMTLDAYEDDNECMVKTRFTKEQIRIILEALDTTKEVRVYYLEAHPELYYKFDMETLFIYMLRKMSTGRTHQDMTTEFGGCPTRWARGYRWLVRYTDNKFQPLIGPCGLRRWADQFPYFAECLRNYIQRDKDRIDYIGPYTLNAGNRYGVSEFNVFSFTDCTVYEVCRPGSGPNYAGAIDVDAACDRKENWYIKQRAFYDGYHRGMEACVKILTICLPNGLTAAIYGPTSGRNDDRTLFHLSQFDDYLMQVCTEFHGGDLYCTYGDGIFAGNWYCLRSMHKPAAGMNLLDWQEAENLNLKSARVSVEWSYSRAEQQWPMLTNKMNYKVDQDSARCFAEIRVMYLLTNFKVCCDEGSTMTGQRGFRCTPPSLTEYINMLSKNI